MPDLILHGSTLSGHCHRVVLLLRALGVAYAWRDAPAPVRATPEFRALNPLGQVPVLQDGPLVLTDSHAILVYLVRRHAPGSHWLPEDAEGAAAVQRWLSLAAGELAFGPARARMVTLWNMEGDVVRARAIADRLLPMMDAHLAGRDWLASEGRPSIADLAHHSYIAHAPEGRVPLDPYPALRAWVARVEALPFFAPMPASSIPDGAP